jgi:tetratricopeptide (TPR) repeat protein
MKIIKIYLTFFLLLTFATQSFAAGTSSSDKKPSYKNAVKLIEAAKKYESKDKMDKALKRYKKAQKILLELDKKKPLQADTLNYLGFTTRKLGDFEAGEKYYLLGLQVEPNHVGINEYLGELYVVTNRIDLAKERLEVLKSCNCEEYQELKEIIDGTKKSKY